MGFWFKLYQWLQRHKDYFYFLFLEQGILFSVNIITNDLLLATTTTTTTTQPLVPLDCSNQKISVIESIAENVHVEDDRAGLCPGSNKHQKSEALVIYKCNATARSTWVPGPKSVCVLWLFVNKINMGKWKYIYIYKFS